jgi:hypothetical protein
MRTCITAARWACAARRVAPLAALTVATAVTACTPAPPAQHARGRHSAVASEMAAAQSARPQIVRRGAVEHDVEPLSIAFGHGSLWLAFRAAPRQGPAGPADAGELFRIDARSLAVTARWPIVGSPVALAVTRRFVWVAGDAYDYRTPVWDANHVEQFTPAGALLHNYPLAAPTGLAGVGDAVWAEYGGGGTRHALIRDLHGGAEGRPLRLNGPGSLGTLRNIPVVACPDGVYATSAHYAGAGRTSIQRFAAGHAAGIAWLAGIGDTSLACNPRGGVLAITDDGSAAVWRVPSGVMGLPQSARLPTYSYDLGTAGGAPWIGLNNNRVTATRIWRLAPATLRPGRPVTVPVNVILSVAAHRYLWTVGQDNSRPNRWIITKLMA